VGLLRRISTAGATAIAAVALAACGEEQRSDGGPALGSPRVAMTADYPGYAPFALVTYRDARGRRCHGLASVTPHGPRVMGALGDSLADGLARRGRCLGADDGDVSVQVADPGRGAPRLVGGIVRAGVVRVVVGGQRVRPRPGGEFLVVHPAGAGRLGAEIELRYRAGGHRRLPLKRVAS
jgi:hypothetical protein